MHRPHSQQDIEDSRQAVQGIQHLRQTNPNLAGFGVDYYLNYSVASRSHLRMNAPHQAEKFIEFIVATGFARTRIHCQLKPQTRAGAISIDQQVMFWAKQLSINPAQITLSQPLRIRGSAHGTLFLILNQQSGKHQTQASYGFRYGIYMMGILMLAAGEVSLMNLAAIK